MAAATETTVERDDNHLHLQTCSSTTHNRAIHTSDLSDHPKHLDHNSITIRKAFLDGQSQWMEEPVISRWTTPSRSISSILDRVNSLYQESQVYPCGPFHPFSDPLWLQTCNILREAGLPWHNNNLNLPDEIDPTWPFHFKEYERQAVLTKGARVGDDNAAGYCCDWVEGNMYAIRALQQELRLQRPHQQPLLVGNCIETSILQSAAQMFGLEMVEVGNDWELFTQATIDSTRGQRPIIFAATLANQQGMVDDFAAIQRLSRQVPLLLHVDASRNFDYLTTLSEATREGLGIPRLVLEHLCLDDPVVEPFEKKVIRAATFVAGGMNWVFPPVVTVLKPQSLGMPHSRVEYVRGTDATLAGSRDALGPLTVALHEMRFSLSGIREVYAQCSQLRDLLCNMLQMGGVTFQKLSTSLDLIVLTQEHRATFIAQKWGGIHQSGGSVLLTVQPTTNARHVKELVDAFCAPKFIHGALPHQPQQGRNDYSLPSYVLSTLIQRVAGWHAAAKRSGGYPLNQAPYSALGPIFGQFLSLHLPPGWIKTYGDKILRERKHEFGVSLDDEESFMAAFTTGSTMGNRVGLHTALANYPNAFVYFSSASHYSNKKSVRDHDGLAGRWHYSKRPRFAEIQTDDLGSMLPEALVNQAMIDWEWCESHGEIYQTILLANIGTTFLGGSDDILRLRKSLQNVGLNISYIHVDGALNFGFSNSSVRLDVPALEIRDGLPVVQGVTVSHHKVLGIMVSGEVICYSPKQRPMAAVASSVDPRIILETWVAQQFYDSKELVSLHRYCMDNATRLRSALEALGVKVRYNEGSLITVLEKPPSWIIERHHLAPEGQWVHYITMPHISAGAVERFVDDIASWKNWGRSADALQINYDGGMQTHRMCV
ncbi:MAG: hypothetical protein Q9170_003778 [Blastenia crenularia]